mmetsp:Transcript_11356/g.13419  ORF Transcript_11356/g.13419 Transcript_11356/m.13419 type:complete len:93 (+) Transcript_11356:144-422(+)
MHTGCAVTTKYAFLRRKALLKRTGHMQKHKHQELAKLALFDMALGVRVCSGLGTLWFPSSTPAEYQQFLDEDYLGPLAPLLPKTTRTHPFQI